MNHTEWAKTATGESVRAIAKRIGVDSSNLSRQMRAGLTADRVIEIARAYDLSIIRALVDTGHISMKEAPGAIDTKITEAIETLAKLNHQTDYGLAADTSPDEGGTPDDYEP